MKILFITPGFGSPFSAISRYVGDMVAGLSRRGHDCHVLTWQGHNLVHVPSASGIVVHGMQRGYWPLIEKLIPESRESWTVFASARKLDRKYHFDVVEIVSNEGIELLAVRYFGGRGMVRLFTTLAQMVSSKEVTTSWKVWVRLVRERWLLRWSKRIAVPSTTHRDALVDAGIPVAKLIVLHLGVEDWRTEAGDQRSEVGGRLVRRSLGKDGRWEGGGQMLDPIPVFLYVGTLDRRKGSDRLMPVMREYCKRYGPCELRIVSNSPVTTLKRFGIETEPQMGLHVAYCTRLSKTELCQQYRDATVLFHPARYESFGLTLIEAAAAGTPVVTTRVGCAPELLAGELVQYLVDGDDKEAIVDTLVLAVQKRDVVGAALRARYVQQFTIDAVVQGWVERWG